MTLPSLRKRPTTRRNTLRRIPSETAILLLAGLGLVDAWAPDEPRFVQVAEELPERVINGYVQIAQLLRLSPNHSTSPLPTGQVRV